MLSKTSDRLLCSCLCVEKLIKNTIIETYCPRHCSRGPPNVCCTRRGRSRTNKYKGNLRTQKSPTRESRSRNIHAAVRTGTRRKQKTGSNGLKHQPSPEIMIASFLSSLDSREEAPATMTSEFTLGCALSMWLASVDVPVEPLHANKASHAVYFHI